MSFLTAGQKAAETRRINRGLAPGAVSTGATGRAAGLTLEMWVTAEGADRLDISFRPIGPDGLPMLGLGDTETSLPALVWQARAIDGELIGFTDCLLRPGQALATSDLERALPLMRRVDRLVSMAREESEDTSFAYVASTLAAHFRVGTVKVQGPDGKVTEAKRGAAYVTAHRLGETLLASQPRPIAPKKAA